MEKPGEGTNTGQVPTLKYLVSESIDGVTAPPHSSILAKDKTNGFQNRTAIIAEASGKKKEGSGDISATITNYLNTQAEIDVGNFIAAAYEKGSALFQAGAELASQIFSEDQMEGQQRQQRPGPGNRRVFETRKQAFIAAETHETTTTTKRVPSSTQTTTQPRIITAKPRDLNPGIFGIQPQVLRKTSTVSAGPTQNEPLDNYKSDDTAFYNGYSIRVRGTHVKLDTLYVNGSGPSRKPLEIRIRLNLPPPRPGLYGQLTREYGGPHNEVLLLKYVHGEVEALVDVICPTHVPPQSLTTEVTVDSFLVLTAP